MPKTYSMINLTSKLCLDLKYFKNYNKQPLMDTSGKSSLFYGIFDVFARFTHISDFNGISFTLIFSVVSVILILYPARNSRLKQILNDLSPSIFISLLLKLGIFTIPILHRIDALYSASSVPAMILVSFNEKAHLYAFAVLLLFFFVKTFTVHYSPNGFSNGIIFIFLDIILLSRGDITWVLFLLDELFSLYKHKYKVVFITFVVSVIMYTCLYFYAAKGSNKQKSEPIFDK